MAHYADNSKALFDYEILKRFTAGMELQGTEVKSIKAGKMNLRGAFVAVRPASTRKGSPTRLDSAKRARGGGDEAYLVNSGIPAYQPKNAPKDYDPLRPRKLLLSKRELAELGDAEKTKRLTIVPLSVYNKGRFLKLDIAIARGKRKFDKRQAIKKRDVEREIRRKL